MSAPFTVTVLGCDGSYPGPGGACSGYLLKSGATSVWLDAGSGTLANLQKFVTMVDLTAVVISHDHVDHWTDLEHLAVACYWLVDRGQIPIYAQESLRPMLRVGSAIDVFDWHSVGDGQKASVGPMDFLFSQTEHSVPALACRVDCGGRSFAYSADTGPGWGFEALGPGIDLALCEATYLADEEGRGLPHLSARQAGLAAERAGVNRLVLTHLWTTVDPAAARAEAEEAFAGPVEVAAIGERYEV